MTAFLHQRVPNTHLPPAFSATWPPCHAPSEARPPFGHAPPASSSPAQAHNTQGAFTLQTFTLALYARHLHCSPLGYRHLHCSPLGYRYLHCSPLGYRYLHCSPLGYRHLHSSPLYYRHLHCSPLGYRHLHSSPLYYRHLHCSPLGYRHLHCSPLYYRHLHCSPLYNIYTAALYITFTQQPFTLHLHYSLGLAGAQARLLNLHLQSAPELNCTFDVLISVCVSQLSQVCQVQMQHPTLFVSGLSAGHANILPDAAGIQQTTIGYVQYFQLSPFSCCFCSFENGACPQNSQVLYCPVKLAFFFEDCLCIWTPSLKWSQKEHVPISTNFPVLWFWGRFQGQVQRSFTHMREVHAAVQHPNNDSRGFLHKFLLPPFPGQLVRTPGRQRLAPHVASGWTVSLPCTRQNKQ